MFLQEKLSTITKKMNHLTNNAIFIVGPTASGKTALAHKIFENFNISLISMDSMQIYKYLDIGTSKPSKEEINYYKYSGIDIVEPDVHFSTGDYLRYCEKVLDNIYKKNKIPLFVGGTGLYFDSLTKGFDDIPEADMSIRRKLEEKVAKYGIEYLYNELKQVDETYAIKIAKNDKKRIIRALEVYILTSKPFSAFHKKMLFDNKSDFKKSKIILENSKINFKDKKNNLENNKLNYVHLDNIDLDRLEQIISKKENKILKIGTYLPREILYKRINERVDLMIKQGFVEEANFLYNRYKGIDAPAFKAIGYSHLFKYFEESSKGNELDEVIDRIKRDTRRYAKRQLTWFKRDPEIIWINLLNIDKNIDKIIKIVKTYIGDIYW